MTRINVGMIKNNYVSKIIRKINYIPREKKMRINTIINDTTNDVTISIIEIRKNFDYRNQESSICSIVRRQVLYIT